MRLSACALHADRDVGGGRLENRMLGLVERAVEEMMKR